MRRFQMYRRGDGDQFHTPEQRVATPDQVTFEGVVFSDGACVIRWMTVDHSTAFWPSFDSMMKIHGHPEYKSELVWLDEEPEADDGLHYATCPKCDTQYSSETPIENTFCQVCRELGYQLLGILNSQPKGT